MSETHTTALQAALEAVVQLTYEEKEMLFEIVYRRLIEERRSRLVADVAESREAYREDQVGRGSPDDLIEALEE